MNPYQVLGVPRKASAARITKAFRVRAMQSHPDRGGSREEFERVSLAYRVLNDPGRRARYDQTGTIEDAPDNRLGPAMQVLAMALRAVIGELLKLGKNPGSEDVAAHMRTVIENVNRQLAETRQSLTKVEKLLTDSVGRFETEDADNLLDELVRAQLAGAQGEVQKIAAQEAANRQALDILKRAKFRHVLQAARGWSAPSASTTGYFAIG